MQKFIIYTIHLYYHLYHIKKSHVQLLITTTHLYQLPNLKYLPPPLLSSANSSVITLSIIILPYASIVFSLIHIPCTCPPLIFWYSPPTPCFLSNSHNNPSSPHFDNFYIHSLYTNQLSIRQSFKDFLQFITLFSTNIPIRSTKTNHADIRFIIISA